jgi:hypothetical protein
MAAAIHVPGNYDSEIEGYIHSTSKHNVYKINLVLYLCYLLANALLDIMTG